MHARRGGLDQVQAVRHAFGRHEQQVGGQRVRHRGDRAAQARRPRGARAGDPDGRRERRAGARGELHRERGGHPAVGHPPQHAGGGEPCEVSAALRAADSSAAVATAALPR